MAFVSWKEEYAVGAGAVDEQHQQLFIRGGSPKLDVDRVVSELERYTKFHFSAERKNVEPRNLVVFLRDWLVDHILDVDKQAFRSIAATRTARQG